MDERVAGDRDKDSDRKRDRGGGKSRVMDIER